MPQASILIVGAGPSGLVLALTLLRNGVSVRIIEKNDAIPYGQRGAGISPRTLELYKVLGILPEIETSPSTEISMRFYQSPEGERPVKEERFIEILEDRPEYYRVNARILGQDDHQRILAETLQREYGVSVEYGTELTSLESHQDHVIAHIRKAEQEEIIELGWVVGADGARSIVRKQVGLTFLGETYTGNTLVIGDIEVTNGFEGGEACVKLWGHYGDKILIMRPYQRGGKDYYWFALGGANLDDSKVTSDRNALVDSFYEIIGKRYIEFGELRACTPWTANVRMVNKFSEGRVFVVGDAAHVHSPTGGQGLNSGVQDSINLGWKLSLVQNGLADRSLLDSYSQERLPIIAAMLDKTTNLMNKTFHKSTSGIGAGGWLRDWELKQFGINYRGGPLLVDERYRDLDEPVDPYRSGHDGTAHAGDRAPSAPGLVVPGEETRRCLYDLFDVVAHTILVFCRPTSSLHLEVAKVLSGYNGRLVKAVIIHPQDAAQTSLETKSVQMFIDTEGHAYKHYKVQKDEESVVVYIGAVVAGSAGLKSYLSKIFSDPSK